MIQSKLAALLLATATVGAGPMLFIPATAQAQGEVEVSFDFFNDSLSPYGEWIEVGDYGLCWRPNEVGDDWAPYTDGYWSYTDAGWTWVSYEDFGGIVYHYGRWVNVEDEGWCWVPDYEWGPAWVSWRNSDEHVGWAPLPPEARWEPTVGFSVWVDNSYDIGPANYNFCAVEDFGAPVIREVILPRPRNVVIIENTVNITNISVNNFIGVPFCGGPRFDVISHRVRRPIPALKLVRETNITNIYNNTVINKTVVRGGNRNARAIHAVQQGNQLIVAAPRVKRVANLRTALPHIKPKRTIAAGKVRKGWNLVQDPEQRTRLKQKFAQETKGLRPDTAPARAIQTAELKPVPEKGDPNAPSPVATGRRGNRNGKNDRDERPNRPDRNERAAQVEQPMPPGVVPPPQTAEVNDDNRPGKAGRDKNRKERGEKAGIAAGERSPLKPFNPDNAPGAPGRGKNREKKSEGVAEVDRPAAAPTEPMEPAGNPDAQKRKEQEQVARAAEVQEEFRKRQREQAQAGRMENKPGKAEKAGERAERKQEAQAAAAEIRREQQARAAQKEAAREQAAGVQAERQREAMAERQREARREQQGAQAAAEARRQQQQALERRQQRMQSEAAQRRAKPAQDGAMEQRRQQAQAQAQAAAAAQARREQMQAMQRQQAVRQQQAEGQQQRAQAMRQQQMQAQRQMQRAQARPQPQMQQRPQMQQPNRGGGGNGEGRGGREGRREKKD